MKRWMILLLSSVLVPTLCACAAPRQEETAFAVDFENGTVFNGTHTYHFTFSGDRENYHVHITFPDGSTYYWDKSGNIGSGGCDDYAEGRYISSDVLCRLIASKAAPAKDPAEPAKVIFSLLLIAFGALSRKAHTK